MKLDEVIPYINTVKDIGVAQTIIELHSDPDGYYENIYEEICESIKNNISEKELKDIFSKYEENRAIKHFQYIMDLQEELKDKKKNLLLHKKPFISAVLNISDIYALRLYLLKLKEKYKDEDIDYKKYVPEYKTYNVNNH